MFTGDLWCWQRQSETLRDRMSAVDCLEEDRIIEHSASEIQGTSPLWLQLLFFFCRKP
jgi:hypothetical protein